MISAELTWDGSKWTLEMESESGLRPYVTLHTKGDDSAAMQEAAQRFKLYGDWTHAGPMRWTWKR